MTMRVFIITLCLIACAMHVLSQDIIVRPPKSQAQPLDFRFQFSNNWAITLDEVYDEVASEIVLKCYALLYKGKSHVTVHLRDFTVNYQEKEYLAMYIKPGVFSSFLVQCDYWNWYASDVASKGGVILWKDKKNTRACLARDAGCDISFETGLVNRKQFGKPTVFLGELPLDNCSWFFKIKYNCKEVTRYRMFGDYCKRKPFWQTAFPDCMK